MLTIMCLKLLIKGITALSIMKFSTMTLRITKYATLSIVTLSVCAEQCYAAYLVLKSYN